MARISPSVAAIGAGSGAVAAAAAALAASALGAGSSASFAALAGGAVAAVVASCVGAIAYESFAADPLRKLAAAIKETASSDRADLGPVRREAGRGEAREVALAWSDFLAGLDETVGGLKSLADASTEIGDDVEAATRGAASLSGEVGEGIERDKGKVASLDAQIAICRSSVATVKAGLDELAGRVMQDQAASVAQSTAAIEEIVASIGSISSVADAKRRGTDELLALAESGSVRMGRSLGEIRGVVQAAEGLLDIVRVIEDVAQRVDLLAMNAAIEAAHARESGKGFAVVADEIRKLAEATNSQARDISSRLKSMISLMRVAEKATEDTDASLRRVIDGAKDLAGGMIEISDGVREVSQGGTEILGAVKTLVEVTERVRGLSAETHEGVEGVDRALSAISGLSRESLTSAERTGSLIGEMDRTFSVLLEHGKSNARQIAGIDRDLARFKTRRKSGAFVIGYNEVPPFSMTEARGSTPGAANAFLAAVLARMGAGPIAFRKVQSLERLYELLDRGSIDAYALATKRFDARPELSFSVPDLPFMRPRAGFLMRKGEARKADDLSSLRVSTKVGMPSTPSLAASGARMEYLGGAEPLAEGLRLVMQGRADAVYSVIAAELVYMARSAGLAGELCPIYLADPPIELYVAFSPSAPLVEAAFGAAQKALLAERPISTFLEPYLGEDASL